MGRVGASLEIPYPPETAFAVATRIDQLPAWLPEVVTATLLDSPLSPGSRLRLGGGGGAPPIVAHAAFSSSATGAGAAGRAPISSS